MCKECDQEHARPSGRIVQAWQQEIDRNDLQGILLSELLQAAKAEVDALRHYWVGCRSCASYLSTPEGGPFSGCDVCRNLRNSVAALRTVVDKVEKARKVVGE